MKSILKLITTLLVFAIIGFVVYYLISTQPQTDINESNNNTSSEQTNINGNEFDTENATIVEVPTVSGNEIYEISGEVTTSGDTENKIDELTNNDFIKEADENAEDLYSDYVLESGEKSLGKEFFSDSATKLMDFVKVDELSVNVNIRENCVEIIPASDFVENTVYYYTDNGELFLYESISTTVGGSCKYYFKDGLIVDVVEKYDEDIEIEEENASDIIERAELIYNEFLK